MANIVFQRIAEALGRTVAKNPEWFADGDNFSGGMDLKDFAHGIMYDIMDDLGYDDHTCDRVANYASAAARAVLGEENESA